MAWGVFWGAPHAAPEPVKSWYRGIEFSVNCANPFFGTNTEWTWFAFPKRDSGRAPLKGCLKGTMTDAMRACFMAIDENFDRPAA